MGVLQTKHAGVREVEVALRPYGGGNVVRVDSALVVVGHQTRLDPGQGCLPGRLVPEHVGLIAHYDFIAVVAVGQRGDQVAHGPAGGEEASLLSQEPGGSFL